MSSRVIVGLFFLISFACISDVQESQQVFHGTTMGTTYTVTLADPPKSETLGESLKHAIDERLATVDMLMSTYDPESEISTFNQSTSVDWFPVSTDTFTVLRHAQEMSELSAGAFDVTIGPLVEAWGFGPEAFSPFPPTNEELSRLLANVGYDKIELDESLSAIRKTTAGVRSDLSAVAKGYAVDRVADLLDTKGYKSFLIEVGGEVRTRGSNKDRRPWRVGIARPTLGDPGFQRVVELSDASLATSGDYRNYLELEGKRISHTIDPRSGRPVTHRLASVSVVAPLCVFADAAATALGVLGPDEGYLLAVERGWAALLVMREEDGSYQERVTPAFNALVSQSIG